MAETTVTARSTTVTKVSGTRPVSPGRTDRLVRLGDAIAQYRRAAKMSQVEMGIRLGAPDAPVPQTTISRWELGQVHMMVEQLWDIENALGISHGILLKQGGYIASNNRGRSLSAIVLDHPDIHPDIRALVTDTISHYSTYSKELFEREAADHSAASGNGSPRRRARGHLRDQA